MKIYSAQLKGTTTVATGSNVSLTGSFTGSIYGFNDTLQYSSSVDSRIVVNSSRLNNIESTTASFSPRVSNLESKSASVDISISNINSFTASNTNTSLNSLTGSYATTGSNTFFGTQTFSGSVYIANNLVVQGSSSIQYISASSVSIGTNIVQLNTANPSVRFAGLTMIDSGSVGGSGSFLYDSLQDEFIFVHRGNGTNVTSSHFVTGPETYDSLGNETYLTCNVITKGTGKEHLVDSCIFDNGTTTCIKNNLIGTGTISGTTIFGSTITCSPIGCFATSCATSFIGGTGTLSGDLTLQGAVTRNIKFLDNANTNLNAQIQYDQISSTSGQLLFGTNNAGTFATRLTISNTGAATFSNNVLIEANQTSSPLFYAKQTGASGYTAIQFSGNNGTDIGALTTYNGQIYFGSWNGGNGSLGQLQINKTTGVATFSSDIQGGGDLYFNKATRTTIYPTTTNQNLHIKSNGTGILQFNDDVVGNIAMVVGGGSVGIGTSSPGAKLDIAQMGGDNTRTCNALYLRAGNNSDVFNSNQILFGYNCSIQYAHAIKTRHNSNNSIDNAIDFYTWKYGDSLDTKAGQYVMTIAGNGRIGIGTCQPQFTIDLSSDDTTRAIQFYGGAGTDKYGIGKFGGSGATTVFHGGAGASNRVSLGCYNGTTYTPNFEVLGNGVICMINIGSGAGTYALKWNSSTKNVTYDTSSERYKDNIRNSTYGLCHILQLNSRMFEYKDQCRTDIGFIAEELYPIIPELVMLDENLSPNGVSYDRMVSVLVEGMKQQQCTINLLKTCIGIV